jgi:hypothetical protein
MQDSVGGQHLTTLWDFSERIKIENNINIQHINTKK